MLKQRAPGQRNEVLQKLEEIVGGCGLRNGDEEFRMLTWDEVYKLQSQGHEIGSHGRTHNSLHQLDRGEQFVEIMESAREIEAKTDGQVESFCYPNGDYNEDTLACLRESRYRNAVTTMLGSNQSDTSRFELSRFDMKRENLVTRNGVLSRGRLLMRINGLVSG
jgi:peptidoglycan/xylan/chitin deacetylase (PgdA/CDA1 family)